jgi:hypothetical protein
MKTKVIFHASVEIDIEENWQNSAALKQIANDAHRKATEKLKSLPKDTFFRIFNLELVRVHLQPENEDLL